jgi:prolyl-tRNA synthetase
MKQSAEEQNLSRYKMSKQKTTEGLTVKKENFSEWYSQVLERAEITDINTGVKGSIVIRPWGALILENMYKIYEEALQKKSHLPTFMPTFIPEENLKKESSHVKGFTPEVFWLEQKNKEGKIALRPTSETLYTPMFASWIRSYRDLPMKLYQRATVYRFDTKATRPLIRGREFMWIEAHDAFATKAEAEAQVREDIKTTEEVMHQIFGIPFLAMKRPEWDKFAGAEYTIGSDAVMPDGKLIQQPSTHLLGQHFSKPFNAKFKTKDEKEEYIWTTAYGPAISRILASVISTHGDDKGLILPYQIAPIKVRIIPIFNKKNKTQILKETKKILEKLNSLEIKADLDDRDQSTGWKLNESELIGIPFRLELGEKEIKQKKLTLFTRDLNKKETISIKDLNKIPELGKKLDQRLKTKADKFLKSRITNCKTFNEIKNAISKTLIARTNLCSISKEGIPCADKIEKSLSVEIRGVLANKTEKPTGKCAVCSKPAEKVVYIGKAY